MLVGGEALLGDLEDHLAAAEERWHRFEDLGSRPEHADAHGAEHLVAGEDDEVGAHRLHVGGEVGHVLARVDRHERAGRVGGVGEAGDVVERAEHVGHGGDRHELGAVEQSVEIGQVEVAVESSTGIQRSSMPFSAASMCHGTMLAWCSISEMHDGVAGARGWRRPRSGR